MWLEEWKKTRLTAVGLGLLAIGGTAKYAYDEFVGAKVALQPSATSGLPGPTQMRWQAIVASDIECGGVIIAKDWILTAAHCVYNTGHIRLKDLEKTPRDQMKLAANNYVNVGERKRVFANDITTCQKPVVPDDYDNSLSGAKLWDVALIQVPLPIGPKVQIIGRASKAEEDALTHAYVNRKSCNGCGAQSNYELIELTKNDCDPRFICGGNKRFDLHDSGGGLTCSLDSCSKLIGIVNHAHGPDPMDPVHDTYARISANEDFIKKTMAIQAKKNETPFYGKECK